MQEFNYEEGLAILCAEVTRAEETPYLLTVFGYRDQSVDRLCDALKERFPDYFISFARDNEDELRWLGYGTLNIFRRLPLEDPDSITQRVLQRPMNMHVYVYDPVTESAPDTGSRAYGEWADSLDMVIALKQ